MIAALIPARAGSKRVKNKNIRILGKHPLMAWSILVAQQCDSIDDVYVSSDSEEYGEIAERYGAKFIKRPPEAASGSATDFQVIHNCQPIFDKKYRYIAYLRPTTPFRTVSLVEKAINTFDNLQSIEIMDKPPTSLRSIEELSESAYKCFKRLGNKLIPFSKHTDTNLPNQEYPLTYKANGYIDIIDMEYVRNHTTGIWGPRTYGFETPPTIEIDTEFEWELAKLYARHNVLEAP